jgi:hypothetical protein
MHLPTPLGEWYDVERHITPRFARLGKYIYAAEKSDGAGESGNGDISIMRFVQRARTGFFDFDDHVGSIPTNAQPISCQFIDGNKLWTKKPFIQQPQQIEDHPPGALVYNTIKGPLRNINRNGPKVVLAGKLCTFTFYLPPEST